MMHSLKGGPYNQSSSEMGKNTLREELRRRVEVLKTDLIHRDPQKYMDVHMNRYKTEL